MVRIMCANTFEMVTLFWNI